MTREVEEAKVLSAIQTALDSMKVLLRADVKKHWKTLDRRQQFAAGRALASFDGIRADYAKHFSRAMTEKAWQGRANAFAGEKKLNRVEDAYYIVADPKGVAMQNLSACLVSADMGKQVYRLFDAIQNWEYSRTSKDKGAQYLAPRDAATIMEMARDLSARAKIVQAHPVVKPFRQVVYGLQQQVQR